VPTAGFRFRVWVGGELVLEEWLYEGVAAHWADHAASRHAALALADGRPWLIEVYDPSAGEEHGYLRFGTDRRGMVEPMPLDDGETEARTDG
jgi:hypothetical protein